MQSPTPAGWYIDPRNSLLERYWDGVNWTEQTQPSVPQSPLDPPTVPGSPQVAQARPGPGKTVIGILACLFVLGCLAVFYVTSYHPDRQRDEAAREVWAQAEMVATQASAAVDPTEAPFGRLLTLQQVLESSLDIQPEDFAYTVRSNTPRSMSCVFDTSQIVITVADCGFSCAVVGNKGDDITMLGVAKPDGTCNTGLNWLYED